MITLRHESINHDFKAVSIDTVGMTRDGLRELFSKNYPADDNYIDQLVNRFWPLVEKYQK